MSLDGGEPLDVRLVINGPGGAWRWVVRYGMLEVEAGPVDLNEVDKVAGRGVSVTLSGP